MHPKTKYGIVLFFIGLVGFFIFTFIASGMMGNNDIWFYMIIIAAIFGVVMLVGFNMIRISLNKWMRER